MYSAYKLSKQGYSLDILFPIWNESVVPCLVLTVASWPEYKFHRRQIRWSCIPISLRIFQFVVIHTIKDFSIVNEADVFLEFPCFVYDPADVGHLISYYSAFSKTSFYICKFCFTYSWSLAWGTWAWPCQLVKWMQLCSSLNILWRCPSLGLELKLIFSSYTLSTEDQLQL